MINKYKIVLIILFLIIIKAPFGFSMDKFQISTEIQNDTKFSEYRDAYYDVQNVQYKSLRDKRFGRGTSWVKQEIRKQLKDMGLSVHYSEYSKKAPLKSDLIVICQFDYGWGVPSFVRHFSLEARYRKKIEIQFIDAKTKKIIAKILYTRGFFEKQEGDIHKIFNKFKIENPDAFE